MTQQTTCAARWGISEKAASLHDDALVCDLTLPWSVDLENKQTVLSRFAEAGFNFVSLTIAVDATSLSTTIHHLADVRASIMSAPDTYILVETVDDILHAKAEGKLALGFHFQGSEMLESDVNLIRLFYDLGIRHMILAYNQKNKAADGCHERTDSGLSRYGIKLVQEMNRVGMLLDLTHTGYVSTIEAMEISETPVIFSHSNPHSLRPHPRNIRDDQIKMCAQKDGVIGVVGLGHFLRDNDISGENFFTHINYVADMVGPKHVAIGLDFVYYPEQFYSKVVNNPERWPKEYIQNLDGFTYFPPEQLPQVTEILIKQGYSDENIRGILGENYLRVVRQVWK